MFPYIFHFCIMNKIYLFLYFSGGELNCNDLNVQSTFTQLYDSIFNSFYFIFFPSINAWIYVIDKLDNVLLSTKLIIFFFFIVITIVFVITLKYFIEHRCKQLFILINESKVDGESERERMKFIKYLCMCNVITVIIVIIIFQLNL